jgi:hypothetical protein
MQSYLLQASEQAAAEKQLATHPPTEPSAGSAIQLSAAPMLKDSVKKENCVRKKRKKAKKQIFSLNVLVYFSAPSSELVNEVIEG